MQIKIFSISTIDSDESNASIERMNKFLRSYRIIEIKKEFVSSPNNSFWTFCITYLESPISCELSNRQDNHGKKEKIDYKETLSSIEFERFCILRKIRKIVADADAVPAYAVYTDAELAELSKFDITVLSLSDIKSVQGIGVKKTEKYGSQIIAHLSQLNNSEQ